MKRRVETKEIQEIMKRQKNVGILVITEVR